MKNILILAFAFLIGFSPETFAQKTGHVNLNDLLLLLPERKKAESDIQEFAKQLEGQLKTMRAEYENKISEYQAKEAMMTDPVKLDRQKEIANLEERIQNFQQTAQESLQKKQNDLLDPMIEKCKKAIAEVAKENGYKTVIDSSQGVLLYADDSDDLMNLVKKKMGITDAPASAPAPTTAPANKK
jgi:outer membrane protein